MAYGHRLSPASPTGIHRYVRELLGAMDAVATPDLVVEVAGSPEPAAPDAPGAPGAVPVAGTARPAITARRRPLHLRWCLTGTPALEQLIGPFDLLHVLYPSTPVPTSSPSVVTVHDLMPLTHPDWFARYERWAFERAVTAIGRATGPVITDSAAVGSDAVRLLGLDPGRIRVVPLGVAGDFLDRAPTDRAVTDGASAVLGRLGLTSGRYVVALGSVSTRKNLTTLLDAWPAVVRTHPDLRLVLAGPTGVGGPAVIDRARRHGDTVLVTGWLPAGDVGAVVRHGLALVQPSLAEGFGMTPLEAMAAGVPVVVSTQGSLTEVVGDAALRVDALDPRAWADAIGLLADDGVRRAALTVAGRTRAAAFTWRRTADRTVAVYREVLGLDG